MNISYDRRGQAALSGIEAVLERGSFQLMRQTRLFEMMLP
jgi:hypothetical protein